MTEFDRLGWPETSDSWDSGSLEIACAVVYAIPRTAVLGAILITGYLGGAVATHLRIGDPFFGPIIPGVLVWVGLYFRDARLRALLPLRIVIPVAWAESSRPIRKLSRWATKTRPTQHEGGNDEQVRVLVGTKKGALHPHRPTASAQKWDVSGPHFAGWEIYHMKGSPVDPEPHLRLADQRLVRAGHSALRRRRQDLDQPGTPAGEPTTTPDGMPKGESNKFVYDTSPQTGKPLTTHQWYDGTQHPWEFKRVWHLEPSLNDPDTVYAGVEDAALFRSTDGGKTWHELAGLRGHGTGPKWSPGAGGMGLHTIVLDPTNPNRIFIAISAAGAFRTDDGGKTWKADQSRAQVAVPARADARGRLLRPSHRDAPVAARTCCSCSCTRAAASTAATTPATTGTRSTATCRPTSASRSTFTPTSRTPIYVVPMDPNMRSPARRQAARLSQQDRRQRVGAADQGPAAGELLRQRAPRRDGRRFARRVRHLLRHHRRPGLLARPTAATTGSRSSATCRTCCRSRCRRWHDWRDPIWNDATNSRT